MIVCSNCGDTFPSKKALKIHFHYCGLHKSCKKYSFSASRKTLTTSICSFASHKNPTNSLSCSASHENPTSSPRSSASHETPSNSPSSLVLSSTLTSVAEKIHWFS